MVVMKKTLFSKPKSKRLAKKMVKLGKITLTSEQRKRTFHLPIKQSVIVPSTSGLKTQRKISQKQLKLRVNNVRKFMSKRFGGFTDIKAMGGFVLRDGRIVKEKVVKVISFATKKDFKKHKSGVINQIGKWGKKWKQESISYENEGDLFIIEPPKKGSPAAMKKIVRRKITKKKIVRRKTRKR